jgi:hypothetical protein
MVALDARKFRYRVDASDVVVWVDSWWLAFARENGATELTEAAVLGRSLWDFVAGSETQRIYRELHVQVRRSGRPAVVMFRCDSPSLQRHMRLKVTRDDEDLLYESVLLRVEPQHYLSVLDAEQPRSDSFLTMCSVCKRALLETSGWLNVDDICNRLRLLERPRIPELRYAICPDCITAVRGASSDAVSRAE